MLKSIIAGAAFAAVSVLGATAASAAEDWVAVERSIDVNAPAAKVWGMIGGYCDFGKVRNIPCTYTKGTGGLGTVRKLNNAVEEVKVGEGIYSYGYFQTVGTRTNQRYHGNMSVVPSRDGKTSKIVYTLIYDQGVLKDDAERASTKASTETSFQSAIEAMKKMVEGGK
jgi:hypothetical protein